MFIPILEQMAFLFSFIVIGFILSRWKFIPDNSSSVLSKLENMIFVPALILGTFIQSFNVGTFQIAWKLLLVSAGLVLVIAPLSVLTAKLCSKEAFLRKIATYGLAFSNFAYMGNAVMQGIFPEIFADYVLFTLPFWFGIYLWGVPVLLIGNDSDKKGLGSRLKSFVNPMFISMLIGMVLGLLCGWLGNFIPKPVLSVVDAAGACMSPVAMLLTGITIGKSNILALLKKRQLYLICLAKLLVYPLLFIAVFAFIPQNAIINETTLKCAMCLMCMPMGLNAIVIPAGYGKDTTDAAGLALISHTLSVGTIPLMFMLFEAVVL